MSSVTEDDLMILSRGGAVVDTSGETWAVERDAVLHFEELHVPPHHIGRDPVLDGFAAYMRYIVSRRRPRTVYRRFATIRSALRNKAIRQAVTASDTSFLIEVLGAIKHLGASTRRASHAILLNWYSFAADSGFEGFDSDVATAMESIRPQRYRQGVAVLRQDPGSGPLSAEETKALKEGLWRAAADHSLPTHLVLAGLLFYTFGFNPEHLRRLHEEDLAPPKKDEENRILRVPRVKKGAARDRASFFERPLKPRLAQLFDQLVTENSEGEDRRRGGPLFRGSRGQKIDDYVSYKFFVAVCHKITKQLDLKADDGQPLNLHPRRLRYSFASRSVMAGATEAELMEMLDHRTLAKVVFYYKARLDIIPKIDTAIGARIASFADVALGRSKVPPAPPDDRRMADAPFACLVCREFRPVERSALRVLAAELVDSTATKLRPDLLERASEALEALETSP